MKILLYYPPHKGNDHDGDVSVTVQCLDESY